jgi:hypothetical protein
VGASCKTGGVASLSLRCDDASLPLLNESCLELLVAGAVV